MRKHLILYTCIAGALVWGVTACEKTHEELVSCGPGALKKTSELTAVAEGTEPKGKVVFTQTIQLRGSNEVPAVNTTTQGVAILRMTADRKLYSKVIVQRLEEGDALRFAHIHSGATGANGPVIIFLCHTADDFGKNQVQDLSEELFQAVLNNAVYVNAHSNAHPPGIIRGQIR